MVAADVLHPQVHASQGRPVDLDPAIELLPFDVTHGAGWDALLRVVRPDTIVHLAAETGTGQSLTESSRHGMVNVVGTTRMLDALTTAGFVPEHFVLASSRAVYGEGSWVDTDGTLFYPPTRPRPALERGVWDAVGPSGRVATAVPSVAGVTAPNPSNVYAATKLTQEHLLTAWGAALGSKVSILRLQNVYGPGQSLTNSYTGVIALFARLSAAGRPIDVYEDGAIIRDFVYVADVVAALHAAVARPASRLLDIGAGSATTIYAAAAQIARLAGSSAPFVSGRFRDGDVRAASCSIDAARADLGYDPAWPVERGLAELYRWVLEQPEHVRLVG